MKSAQHTARLAVGTEFFVLDDEVISMGPIEQPGMIVSLSKDSSEFEAYASQQDLEAAMAAERETLPSVAQVIRDNPPIAHDAPGKVNEVKP